MDVAVEVKRYPEAESAGVLVQYHGSVPCQLIPPDVVRAPTAGIIRENFANVGVSTTGTLTEAGLSGVLPLAV